MKKRLYHRCFSGNFLKLFETAALPNSFFPWCLQVFSKGQLFLKILHYHRKMELATYTCPTCTCLTWKSISWHHSFILLICKSNWMIWLFRNPFSVTLITTFSLVFYFALYWKEKEKKTNSSMVLSRIVKNCGRIILLFPETVVRRSSIIKVFQGLF